MSWHFLQGQEAASWEGSSLDGAPSALLRLIPTPAASCSHDKPTDASNHSRYGMTLRRSTAIRGEEELTWFQGDSPARTYRSQEKGQDSTGNALDSGPRWRESLARCNPPSSGWKTRQCSLFGGLIEFSGTWPRWGMMRDGELLERTTPALRMNGNGSGWPDSTPTKCMPVETNLTEDRIRILASGRPRKLSKNGTDGSMNWAQLMLHKGFLPTPTLCEYYMGWPTGWTDCNASATAKFQQWCDSHGIPSPEGLA